MKKATCDVNAIPCIVLSFTPDEFTLVKETLEDEGYEDDLKQWILDMMLSDENEEPERYRGAADRVINNVSEFVKENPSTIQAAGALANTILKRMIKKGPPR